MGRETASAVLARPPRPGDVLELLKPVTWFPPMWAFFCGVVSSGAPVAERLPFLLGGVLLAGPLVCGTSQAVNDWFDREVDAINEPHRPIPSGRVPGRWGLGIALSGSIVSLGVAALLGPWVLAAAALGLFLAWAYSAPPLRLKRNGWWGPAACAFAYEGLTWFTGAAVMLGGLPPAPVLLLAALWAAGAFGIMTLNDFKAVAGDRRMGIASLPVVLGERPAALLACGVMLAAEVAVIGLLLLWGLRPAAAVVGAFALLQLLAMRRLLKNPAVHTRWFNGTGIALYVLGMLVSAISVRSLG